MKAAILNQLGKTPIYSEVEEPKINSENEVMLNVKAVAVKNIDKLIASGKHYASYKNLPTIVGMDGVGTLDDGRLVYSQSNKILAEKTVIAKDNFIEIPKEIDVALAAALPNAALGSYLPLMVKGDFQKGDTVLINGGTGITGKFAIQLAKYYGAGKIAVSGRIKNREKELYDLGADILISTEMDDKSFQKEIKKLHEDFGIDLVLDYLWGKTAENIINTLGGDGDNFPNKAIKLINIGNLAGANLNLDCNFIRSSKLEILGSGLGSYSKEQFADFHKNQLVQLFELASQGILSVDVYEDNLNNIEKIWNENIPEKRLVIRI